MRGDGFGCGGAESVEGCTERAAGIRYESRMKDLNQRNAFDQARTGSLGIKPKFVMEILVGKKDAEAAGYIVRTMM